ncbi:MAG TPA: hypothetical protein VM286_04760 [Candidatus Thermoplasmatota archaeon]|nr:hypothetical protein [Candidatus Thermoplasmatota archaeon]
MATAKKTAAPAKKSAPKAAPKPAAKPAPPQARPSPKAPSAKPSPSASPSKGAMPAKPMPKPGVPVEGGEAAPMLPKQGLVKVPGRDTLCQIEIVKDGHFFIARTQTEGGADKEYKNTVFEDLLTEMVITLQEQLVDK